ncbi:MAG: hypothetical protein CMJ46_14560 [Planctomyces sp.]|nr:hypothetical protein [Planctomyces sp.]
MVGCSHFVETRALKQFVAALEEEDLDTLRASTSEDFAEKALRLDESAEDLQLLKIPTKEFEVLEVKEESETSRLVNVRIGESRKTVTYRLIKDDESGKWVVDELYMERRHDGNLKVTKKVTEQMDLYLSCREFLQTLNRKNRAQIEKQMTEEFAGVMHELPDEYFNHLLERIGDVGPSLKKFSPKATLNDDTAVVRLLRGRAGQMDIGMKLVNNRWLVNDLAVEGSDEEGHITSMVKAADGLRSVAIFLKSYSADDKQGIEKVTEARFYKNSIMPGDLKDVTLPPAEAITTKSKMVIRGDRIDIEIPFENQFASLTLKTTDRELGKWQLPGYQVTDVALVHPDSTEGVQKLSSLLTAKARVDLFHQALVKRDLRVLKYSSSHDLNNRVWKDIDSQIMSQLPIELPEEGSLAIEDIVFKGDMTEVYATYGSVPVTYVLRENSGALRIDDVKYPMSGKPNSMKECLEVVIPAYRFAQVAANALPPEQYQAPTNPTELAMLGQHYQSVIGQMRELCSFDFNHGVWKETDVVPDAIFACSEHLTTEVAEIRTTSPDQRVIRFGDEFWGAEVKVVREQGSYRVDEVKLVAGQNSSYDLKVAARDQLNEQGRYLRSLYPLAALPGGEAELPADTALAQESPAELENFDFQPAAAQQQAVPPIERKTAFGESNQIQQVGGWDDFQNMEEVKPAVATQPKTAEPNPFKIMDQAPQSQSPSPVSPSPQSPSPESEYEDASDFLEEFPPLEAFPGQ